MDAWMKFTVLQLVSWGLWFVISFTTFVLPRLEHTIIVKEIAVNLLVNSFMYVLLLVCGYKGWGNSTARIIMTLVDILFYYALYVSFYQRTRFGFKFKVLFFIVVVNIERTLLINLLDVFIIFYAVHLDDYQP